MLRLDFVRERREWARRLELEGDLGIEEEEEEEEEGGDGEMVPLTEEEEIEALVGRELDARGGKRASYGSDEEDYDQLFMQVIGASQELEMEGGGGMNAFGVGMRQQESPQQQQPLQWQEREGMDFICHREEMTDGGSMDLS